MQKDMEKQEIPAKTVAIKQKEISVTAVGQKQEKKQENIWSAMLRSMRIVLLQYRIGLYYMILLSVIIVPLWNLLQVYIEISGYSAPWCIHFCGGIKILLAVIAAFMVCNYNILSRDEISMYPGNVISRYGGTVLAFHIMIVVSVLASIVGYLLQGLVLTAASHLWDSAVLGNAFSLSYLWLGAVRYLGLLLAIYAIEMFWFVLTERFNIIVCYVSLLVLWIGLVILAVRGSISGKLQFLRNFFRGQGYSYTALIAVLFGVWAILMALSFFLAATVKVWKAADRKRLAMVICLVYFALMGGVWLSFGGREGYEYSMDPVIFQKESQQQREVVADVSAWEEKDIDLLSGYDMSVKYRENGEKSSGFQGGVFAGIRCSASEAKSYGLSFDESKLDQDHVILLLGSRNLSFAGKDLGEGAVQAYQRSCKLVKNAMDEKYQEENPEEEFEPDYSYQTEITNSPLILLNTLYGNLGMYMDDTTLYEEGGFWGIYSNVVTELLLRIVIYPDEWDQEMVQE